MTFDGTVSPRTMLIATASPLHGANSFRHRISPLLKHSHWWRLGTHIGGNVFVKTTVTTPELESDQLYSRFWKTRRMTTTPTTDEDELNDDHSYDG
ncbi:hypothetical protein U9M48_024715 [Paspalum notatum var. saurae]|uniref:Uncharacterized protein n=1 Tax=Paspalum notatum var. saurae TaxID=547442 RepID=A0AAQ3WXA2_PASNO